MFSVVPVFVAITALVRDTCAKAFAQLRINAHEFSLFRVVGTFYSA